MGVKKVGKRWVVRWVDENGKDKRRIMPAGSSKEEADAFLTKRKQIINDIRDGVAVRDRNPHALTVADVAKKWLRGRDDRLTNAVTNHIVNKPIGQMPLDKVTPARITQFLDTLEPMPPSQGQKKPRAPLSARTRNHMRKHLVQIFEYAIEHGDLTGTLNPAREVKPKKVPKKKALATYSAHEAGRLVHAVEQPWRGILACALHGMRKGEIWGLNIEDVDLTRNEFMVRRSHDRDMTKNGRERVVPIIPTLRPAIVEAVELATGRGGVLFPGRDGARRNERANPANAYHRAIRLAKIGRVIRFHDLRHTTATLLIQAGAPIERVSKVLGHSSIAITVDIYGHLVTADLHAAVARLSFDLPGGAS